MAEQSSVFVERVDDPALLNYLEFVEDRAEIVVSGDLLSFMPFDVDHFEENDDYWQCVDKIRSQGYGSAEPISVWPAENNRWVVDDDDADRFMAARRVATDFFTNLLSTKVRKVRFVLHARSLDGRFSAPQTDFGYG